jgi:hypothetical protein
MLVRIEPDQISNVVSKELQQLYADIKDDENFEFTAYAARAEILNALTFIIEYYTVPSEFDIWRKG